MSSKFIQNKLQGNRTVSPPIESLRYVGGAAVLTNHLLLLNIIAVDSKVFPCGGRLMSFSHWFLFIFSLLNKNVIAKVCSADLTMKELRPQSTSSCLYVFRFRNAKFQKFWQLPVSASTSSWVTRAGHSTSTAQGYTSCHAHSTSTAQRHASRHT